MNETLPCVVCGWEPEGVGEAQYLDALRRVRELESEITALRARLAEAEMAMWSRDITEGAPVLPGAPVALDPVAAAERVLGVSRQDDGSDVIDADDGPLIRGLRNGRWWVLSEAGDEIADGYDGTFADACLALLRLIAAGKVTHDGPGLSVLTPEERRAFGLEPQP